MIVALTDTGTKGIGNYIRWLQSADDSLDSRVLSHKLEILSEIERSHGIVLTGGGDVHPGRYGREDALPLVEDVDEARDQFELQVIRHAQQLDLPILGICRGMQVFNVAMGGSLIPDLETSGYAEHRKGKEGGRVHDVSVVAGTCLAGIVKCEVGLTNTNHHQGVDRVGQGLCVTTRTVDGLIEGLEWHDASRRPFLQLVQWHPERMGDMTNPFSGALLRAFLEAVGKRAGAKKVIV